MPSVLVLGLAVAVISLGLVACRGSGPPKGRIAFMSIDGNERGIHVINADGSSEVNLTNDGGWPAWSPDGTKIAFIRLVGEENHEVFVMNADGTNEINVSNTVDQGEEYIAWAPDGSAIAFLSTPLFPVSGPAKVQIVNPDGSGRHLLTGTPAWSFAWAPDSRRIAYVALRDESGELGYVTDLYVANSDGSGIRLVTAAPLGDDQQIGSVAWMPDGKGLLFDAYRQSTLASQPISESVIYRLAPDGSRLKQLTQFEASYAKPLPSPDGKRIAFSDSYDGIWVMDPDGGHTRRLSLDLIAGQPTWSPDGRYVAFTGRADSDGTVGGDLYVLNAGGGPRRTTQVTQGSRVESPAWAPR